MRGGHVEDPLETLDSVHDRPLAEQVGVFEAIHARLSARLSAAED